MSRDDYWFLLFTVELVGYLVSVDTAASRTALLVVVFVSFGRHAWYTWRDR